MAQREFYGIRTSLNKSLMESQIQFGSGSSLSISKKPITIATFIITVVSMVLCCIIYGNSIIASGGLWGKLLYFVGYIGTFWCLMTRTKTLNYKLSYLPVYAKYWKKHNRFIKTGLLDNGHGLENLYGIDARKGIDEDGKITFTNGEIGYLLEVVGNASNMIFARDQAQVINDARTIYKNIPPTVGLTLITQSSVQDVQTQIKSKIQQLQNLQINDPGLRQVIKKQGLVLRDAIGTNFTMVRQYLLVRGDRDLVLQTVNMLLQQAMSSSSQYLKSGRILTNEKLKKAPNGLALNTPHEAEKLLATVFNDYQGK